VAQEWSLFISMAVKLFAVSHPNIRGGLFHARSLRSIHQTSGGNVWELNEGVFDRGGSCIDDVNFLQASSRGGDLGGAGVPPRGFRVANAAPEPSTMLLAGCAVLAGSGLLRRQC
jgi:hypothetical protein